jgi:hypothetical protein
MFKRIYNYLNYLNDIIYIKHNIKKDKENVYPISLASEDIKFLIDKWYFDCSDPFKEEGDELLIPLWSSNIKRFVLRPDDISYAFGRFGTIEGYTEDLYEFVIFRVAGLRKSYVIFEDESMEILDDSERKQLAEKVSKQLSGVIPDLRMRVEEQKNSIKNNKKKVVKQLLGNSGKE